MTFLEINGVNIFTMTSEFYLAHCISSDFVMGAGIAKQFTQRGVKTYLQQNYKNIWSDKGYSVFAPLQNYQGVYNLVTKEKYYYKPTYATVEQALISLRDTIPDGSKLAMPKIATGLDKLQWERVKEIILKVFAQKEISIVICSLN